jgi:glc operon protein GlcG
MVPIDRRSGLLLCAIAVAGLAVVLGLTRASGPFNSPPPARKAVEDDSLQQKATRDEKPAGALASRNRIQLNLAGAEVILAAARAKAQAMKVRENIYVVDDGGHPIAFARMDGARPGSAYTALSKAVTAATMRAATGPLPNAKNPDLLLNLSLQNAASAGGGKFTSLQGGVPIVVDEQVIGAVGCGGGTGEQDAEVARAGVQALLDELKKAK